MITEEIKKDVRKGMIVLDVGAGDLKLAKKLVNKGALVDAIDIVIPTNPLSEVNFFKASFEEIPSILINKKYDMVIALNSLQFCDKTFALNVLLPLFMEILKEGGRLYLETFLKKPTGFFPKIKSFYSLKDFEKFGTVVYGVEDYEEDHKINRHVPVGIHFTDCIIEKPKNTMIYST